MNRKRKDENDFSRVARVKKPEPKRRTMADAQSGNTRRTVADHLKELQREEYERRRERGLEDARRIVEEGRRKRESGQRSGAWNPGASAPAKRKRGGGGRPPWV